MCKKRTFLNRINRWPFTAWMPCLLLAISRNSERIGLLQSRKVGKENLYLNMHLYELLAK